MVKLNTAALLVNNVSILHERTLNEHWTALLGSGYRWGGSTPKVLGFGDVIVSSTTAGITGFSLTPEIRYYVLMLNV